eukprot:3515581-Rhodomonas_salina.2
MMTEAVCSRPGLPVQRAAGDAQGKCLLKDQQSHYDEEAACHASGGTLASITSADEEADSHSIAGLRAGSPKPLALGRRQSQAYLRGPSRSAWEAEGGRGNLRQCRCMDGRANGTLEFEESICTVRPDL